MKKIFVFTLLLLFINGLSAQKDTLALRAFNREKNAISQAGMYTLGAWALGNFALSGAGWARGTGSNMYFHMGNVLWNTVNLAIALPGIIGSYRKPARETWLSSWKKQKKTETVYFVNAALDIAYITGGFGLRALSSTPLKPAAAMRWEGFGNALLLQGAFLLVFDVAMLTAHKMHAGRRFGKIQPWVSAGPGGFYTALKF